MLWRKGGGEKKRVKEKRDELGKTQCTQGKGREGNGVVMKTVAGELGYSDASNKVGAC